MGLVSPLPLNTIGWGIGALAVLLFGYKSWRSYQSSGNYLSKYFGIFGLVMGTAFVLLSVPSFFTDSRDVLRATYLASDLLVYSGFLLQVPVLWFVGLKQSVRLPVLLVPAVAISAVGWVDNVRHFDVAVVGRIVEFYDSPLALQLQTALLFLIIIPTGLFFLREGVREYTGGSKRASAKSIIIGTAYVVVGFIVAINNLQARGIDSVESSITNIVIFSAMFIALLTPAFRNKSRDLIE